ncbi:MAG: helix-turn-helix transcriptional regulator [Desulfobacterales bacterium]
MEFLDLKAADFNYRNNGDNGKDICRIMMCLDGDLQFFLGEVGRNSDIPLSGGGCCLEYQPFDYRCLRCTRCNRAQLLELVCPASEFIYLVGGTLLEKDLKTAVDNCRPLYIFQQITPEVHQALMVLRDALTDSDHGVAPLVLAKSLEMIWWFARAIDKQSGHRVPVETRLAVEKAKRILESRMSDPPSLDFLAAEVAMSLSKFKQVFPMVCGMTPYSYLRSIRMVRAKFLILHKNMSVTQAALEVGYNNLSHFSKIFTEFYGIRPSQL